MQVPTGLLKSSSRVAVLTGAGVLAESGIPTFRSNRGYWQKYRFEDLATPEAFHRDPKFVWTWYEERRRAIVAGTSAQVYPEATGFSDGVAWSLRGTSAGILPQLVP